MAVTNTWAVVQMDCYPEEDGETDVVFNVHWTLTGEEAFAEKWSTLLAPEVSVGTGTQEGAAGSLYYTAPVTIVDGKLVVPHNPIIPFIEGDGTGRDIWRASVRVLDAAVEKTYGGKRKLSPKLVGDRIGLHPVAVIFAVMAGGQLFGFTGVLLGLPASAVIMAVSRVRVGCAPALRHWTRETSRWAAIRRRRRLGEAGTPSRRLTARRA